MFAHIIATRIANVALLTVIFSTVLAFHGEQAGAADQPGIDRGNPPGEWRYWGADAWNTRYSPLDKINASNFDALEVAWQWNAQPFGPDEYYRATPLYAKGRLFTVASSRRVAVALDPESGETLWMWRLDEGIRWQKTPRRHGGRGLAYWTDDSNERIIVVTTGYHMVSLDATTGIPDQAFGENGVVDLMAGLGFPLVPLAVDDAGPFVTSDLATARKARPNEGWDEQTKTGADGTVGIDPAVGQFASTSPPIVVNDVIIVGNSSVHGYYPVHLRNLPSYIRGFDVRTGKLLWKFNLIPEPGEYGSETWVNGSAPGTPGVAKADAWANYAADPELGLVYIPVGMPFPDHYGGHRPGDNLFANSIVALDVKTGERRWHFQMVHHDIWNYDTPISPNLLDAVVERQRRKIVAQSTKQGWLYVFDRITGEPIWPIVETAVPQSEVPGEQTAKTQPIPSKPAPYAQQGLVEEDLIDYTSAIKEAALNLARQCRMGPYYIPPSLADASAPQGVDCSWYAPGATGGVNINGGATVDPGTGMLYVGAITGLTTLQLANDACSEFRYGLPFDSCGLPGALPTPAGHVRADILSRGGGGGGTAIGGVPIIKPKRLGGITAYDMNGGEKAWWIPNGGQLLPVTSDDPLFAGVSLPPAPPGRGHAQVITTKSLVIYGTGPRGGPPGSEAQLYAVDKTTGKQVGAVAIPSKTSAVPMTFLHRGRQYIVFATGGGSNTSLVALALPDY
jgi:quinoprotein glucose dehydrogenase